MPWLALWIAISIIGMAGTLVTANSIRFDRRVAREVRAMWAATAAPRTIDRGRIVAMPAPVRTYLAKARGNRSTAIRTVRLRHGAVFRASLDGPWNPIRGVQYETVVRARHPDWR
jgi:hypothetical protein